MARPRPRPPNWRVTLASPCSKALKMRGSTSGEMPMPLSLTRTSERPPGRGCVHTRMAPRSGVNLMAFLRTFHST